MRMPRFDRFSGRVLLLVLISVVAAVALPASAGATPGVAAGGVVSGAPSSSWQTNGTVWALAYANGKIYLGGDFTSVRPPGAAAGTNEVPRNHLAAFYASTGELVPQFNPNVDAVVWALAASPDGSKVYAGGDFLTVGGVSVRRVSAFDTSTDTRISTWNPKPASSVRALEVSPDGSKVYMGGYFQSVSSVTRTRLAAVDAITGAVTPWAPTADAQVLAIAASKDGNKIYAGGKFEFVNGQAHHAIAALDAATGSLLPFSAETAIPPVSSTCVSSVKDLVTDATTVYSANEGNGGGCFDGTFAANVSDGTLKWKNTCLGATQSVEVIGSWLYKGSHAHNCSSVPGGFPEVPPGGKYHLLVQKTSDGLLGPWYADPNGMPLGPHVFATDGKQLFVGGDSTYVNGKPQQGFTRFAGTADTGAFNAPPLKPAPPTVASVSPGTVKFCSAPTYDRDDNDITYSIMRDGSQVPLQTWSVDAPPWSLYTTCGTDTGLAPGSTHTYKVQASDNDGGVNKSLVSATVTVADSNKPYPDHVLAEAPSFYWRLGETSGTTAADATGNGRTGNYGSGTTKGQAGAIAGNTAVAFSGTSSGYVTRSASVPGPQKFSVEAWFRTTTIRGGKILGFGNSQAGNSSNYDRHVYMTNTGQLVFGVYPGQVKTVTSPGGYNDGNWHHMIATLGTNGMALYVDGALVGSDSTVTSAQAYTGYWRVGGDNLGGWPSIPASSFFDGTVDEVAVYDRQLSAADVSDHFSSR